MLLITFPSYKELEIQSRVPICYNYINNINSNDSFVYTFNSLTKIQRLPKQKCYCNEQNIRNPYLILKKQRCFVFTILFVIQANGPSTIQYARCREFTIDDLTDDLTFLFCSMLVS